MASNTSTYKIGSYVSLHCQAISRPKPTFTWFKNGVTIILENNTEIKEISLNSTAVTRSILIFSPLTTDDLGRYQCLVRNQDNTSLITSANINISKLFL